jgi:hypothetical protein
MREPHALCNVDLSPDAVDYWAVDLVVREGVLMNLSYTEQVVAVRQMWERGITLPEMAVRLRCSLKDVRAMIRRWDRFRQMV